MADFLSVTACSASTESMMLLGLLATISVVMIGFGLLTRLGFFGVFGSVSLLVFAWYLTPCVSFIAYAVALMSVVSFMYFMLGSGLFWDRNDSFS